MKKNYFVIAEQECQEEWPFTKKRVMISKDGFSLYVRVNHKKYNLNGCAAKGRPLEEIWKMREGCEYRVPIGWLINMAHERLK